MLFYGGARMEGTCMWVDCKYLVNSRHVLKLWELICPQCNRGGKARLWETQNWTNNEIKNPPGLWVKVGGECKDGQGSLVHLHTYILSFFLC